MSPESVIKVYIDGSCIRKIGGWGAVLTKANDKFIKSLWGATQYPATSNIAELSAFTISLNYIIDHISFDSIHYFTDSLYLARGFNEYVTKWSAAGWKKNIKNQPLFKRILQLKQQYANLKISHIPRNSHKFNTYADILSRKYFTSING